MLQDELSDLKEKQHSLHMDDQRLQVYAGDCDKHLLLCQSQLKELQKELEAEGQFEIRRSAMRGFSFSQ